MYKCMNIKMYSNQQKWIPMLFAIKSSFKFPALATPKEVDHVIKDWWRMTSLQEHIQAACLYFAVTWRPHCFANLSLFDLCRGKLLTTTETTVTWTRRISWFLTWRPDPFRNPDPFLHWHTVTFVGHIVEAGTLEIDLRALKRQNPIFFLKIPFYTLLELP